MFKTESEIFREIEKIPEKEDVISLTGGEPTLRNDLLYILKKIMEKRPHSFIRIMTNGRMFFYKQYVKKISETGRIGVEIPVYSHRHEIHDKITRVTGSFNETTEGIKNVLESGMKLGLRIIVQKSNFKELDKISRYFVGKFKKLDKITFVFAEIMGNAYDNRNEVGVTYAEVRPFIKKAVDFLKGRISDIRLYNFPLCVLDREMKKYAEGRRTPKKRLYFLKECEYCEAFEKCNLVNKTYFFMNGGKEFRRIGKAKKPNKINLNHGMKIEIGKKCSGCLKCEEVCPTKAISAVTGKINLEKCILCYSCRNVCPNKNIKIFDDAK